MNGYGKKTEIYEFNGRMHKLVWIKMPLMPWQLFGIWPV